MVEVSLPWIFSWWIAMAEVSLPWIFMAEISLPWISITEVSLPSISKDFHRYPLISMDIQNSYSGNCQHVPRSKSFRRVSWPLGMLNRIQWVHHKRSNSKQKKPRVPHAVEQHDGMESFESHYAYAKMKVCTCLRHCREQVISLRVDHRRQFW